MASVQMSFDQFGAVLARKAEEIARLDYTPALRIAAVAVRADTLLNFAHSSDPEGRPWQPLKNPAPRRGSAPKPLLDHGILRAASTSPGPHHAETITRDSLTVTNNLSYAGIHNLGGIIHRPERRRVKPWVFTVRGKKVFTRKIRAHNVVIPQRQFMGFGPRLLSTLDDIFSEFLAERLGAV